MKIPIDAGSPEGNGTPSRSDGCADRRGPRQPHSLIETMRREAGGALPLLDRHLQRLRRSCEALGYPWPGAATIHDHIDHVTAALPPASMWRVRLLLASDGAISVETGALAPPQEPLRVMIAGPRATGSEDWLLHKTTHRPWYEVAAAWLAGHPHVFDVLYWNADGEMCEGSRSNLYMLAEDGRWLTPPLSAGVLPGVQRGALLDAGQVEEAVIRRDDFVKARAWRVSNALRGWRDAVIVGAFESFSRPQ